MSDRSGIENIHLHRGKRALALMFAMAVVLAGLPARMFAQIQLDGDAKKSTGTGSGTDWDEINCPNADIVCTGLTGGGNSIAKTGLVVDRPEPSFAQFTGGGAKDEADITSWRHRGGTPPAKDDLSHAFAAAFQKSVGGVNHTILSFGMDRYDTSGAAQLGFWFLAQNVQPIAGGTFGTSQHQDGDLLVLVNFSVGGTTPTIQVYKWLGGAVVSQGIGGQVLCSGGTIPAGQDFCGITNGTSVDAPWSYDNKDAGVTTSFPSGAFFEGGIDLTAAGLEGCFTGFIAESRSSTSIDAVLKDFADPGAGFNLCSIDVTKQCSTPVLNSNQTQITYIIRGTVTNTGSGRVYNVALSDNPAANGVFQEVVCGSNPATPADSDADGDNTFPLVSLAGGASACYSNTITVALGNGNKDTVTVTANSKSDSTGTTLTGSKAADCPDATIPAALTVTKGCSTLVEDAGSNLVVKINVTGQVCNTGGVGSSNLSQVTVLDGTTTVLSGETLRADTDPNTAGAQGECKPYSFSYYPLAANSTTPGSICFQDTVTASAKDIFNATVTAVPAVANCSLCPGTTCPAPAP